MPITVVSHRRNYTRPRTYLLASGIGLGHGASSAVLSLAIAEIGAFFFLAYRVNLFAVFLLLVIALYIAVNAAKEARAGAKAESVSVLVSVIPDPALVPFILVAQGFGAVYTGVMSGAFAVAAVASVTLVVFLATKGLSSALSRVKPQHVDYLVALALVLVAVFMYFSG
ncbi:MAG: hypothetical protein JRN21_01860 [Nitrososphaerota archaeon]|nr:hypothetical protein [Nitrososphaerota archaeon]